MFHRMRRREFLRNASRAALAIPFLPRATSPISDLERQLPQLMAEATVPGLSIAIIKDAKLHWRRGFGVKDGASKKPVDNDTIFEAASMSKPVFAYAVMKLCEKGMLALDTPLTRYSPERFLEGDPRLDLITARHVLSHTSGFQNWRSKKEPLAIHFTPGEKYMYSGEGYSYLQSVVARVTGQPIEPYMKANLFAPFGMSSCGYFWNDMYQRRMARPHDQKGQPLDNRNSDAAEVTRYGSSGALLTTPTDYAKFVIEVIDPKPSNAFRLKKASLDEMLRPQVKTGEQYPSSWALGWKIVHTDTGDLIVHGGDNPGFHSVAVASAPKKSGFVIMTNSDTAPPLINKLLLGDLMKPFV